MCATLLVTFIAARLLRMRRALTMWRFNVSISAWMPSMAFFWSSSSGLGKDTALAGAAAAASASTSGSASGSAAGVVSSGFASAMGGKGWGREVRGRRAKAAAVLRSTDYGRQLIMGR